MTARPSPGSAAKLGLLVLAVLLGVTALTSCGGGDGGGSGYSAKDLKTGEDVSVSSLRGKPALLVSWATWCRECDEELAGLAEFAASPEAKDLSIVAVNLDAGPVDDEIDAKIAKHGLTVDLWRDRKNQFKREFGALGVPTTVLLDAKGEVAGTFPGAMDFDDKDVLAALEKVRAA